MFFPIKRLFLVPQNIVKMRKKKIGIAHKILMGSFLLTVLFVSSSFSNPPKFDLTVNIYNIQKQKGTIEVSLYNKPKFFPKIGKHFKKIRVKVTGNEVTCKFKDIPKGKYAIGLYHDVNNDKKCNRNFVGYPTEAFAFSRNYRPFMSPPDFEDCSIGVWNNKTTKIKMVY